MKIVCISASFVPSETANSIQMMKAVHALAQLGHNVTLLVPENRPQSSIEDLQSFYGLSTPFRIEQLHSASRRRFFWEALRRATKLGPDIAYTWVPQSAVYALLHRMPVILELHDLPSGPAGPWWYRLFLWIPGRKRIMVITHALQLALENKYGKRLAPEDTILAPNGIEPERFENLPAPQLARRQLGLAQSPTVICTGHLYAGRGVELFLQLARGVPDAQFIWAGGKPEDVAHRKAQSAPQSNVTFTGFIPNDRLPLYQAAADVLLMPYGKNIGISSGGGNSAAISSPMKMFEYLAASRAIVASDLPVFREVLNERNAVFCPPDDVPAWTAAVRSLLDDPARREALSLQAKQDSRKYAWTERAKRALKDFEHS
jgi:glycosyltransferase involved in cell wall biosynthesis